MGRPLIRTTDSEMLDENVKGVIDRMIVDDLRISKGKVQIILKEKLCMRKLCAKTVSQGFPNVDMSKTCSGRVSERMDFRSHVTLFVSKNNRTVGV